MRPRKRLLILDDDEDELVIFTILAFTVFVPRSIRNGSTSGRSANINRNHLNEHQRMMRDYFDANQCTRVLSSAIGFEYSDLSSSELYMLWNNTTHIFSNYQYVTACALFSNRPSLYI